jgi:predicted nuclease of predicted toxin-antitoxin system
LDQNKRIIGGVVRQVPEIDFQTANDASLHGLTDAQVLTVAARDGRVLVKQDQRTMPAEFGEFIRTNNSPGVVIISQKRATRRAIEGLIIVWMSSDADEYVNSIRNLLT